jgi:hypothetical protein
MDQEFEKRFTKMEKLLEDHLPNLYAFIDELRQSHKEHERRFAQNEEMIRLQVEMNEHVLRLLDKHEDRMNAAGI